MNGVTSIIIAEGREKRMLPKPMSKEELNAKFNGNFFVDPARTIAKSIAKQVRDKVEAGEETPFLFTEVHRIGLMSGVGFTIPDNNNIGANLVRIISAKSSQISVYVEFVKVTRHEDYCIPNIYELLKVESGILISEVLSYVEGVLYGRA